MDKQLNKNQKHSEFEREVSPHLNVLKRYALKITNDVEESEDLVQDTMLKAFKFFKSFRKGSNSKSWLFKIMINSYINDYRKKAKQPFKVDCEDGQNFYENINPEEVKTLHYKQDAFNNILSDEVINALTILPDDFRTIIFLSDVEGYSYQEISDFVDCPIGTVRSRLHRTRKILYTLLYNYAVNNGYAKKQIKYPVDNSLERSALRN